MKQVKVRYFAVFREQAGRSVEVLETKAGSLADLFDELRARYAFTLSPSLVRASVASEFRPMDTALHDGDEVVFIPPVAGG